MQKGSMQVSLGDYFLNSFDRTPSFFLENGSNFPQEGTPQDYLAETRRLLARINDFKLEPSVHLEPIGEEVKSSVDEALFDACARVKILTSQISMHLRKGWREKFFEQLDLIHDPYDWEEKDNPINEKSFGAFIKWFIAVNPKTPPGLGLTSSGNLVAAWIQEKNRLTIEFGPKENSIWAIIKYTDGDVERASGRAKISRLNDVLSPYGIDSFMN